MDYYLAPYVAKSYVRNCAQYLNITALNTESNVIDKDILKEDFLSPLLEYINENNHILTDEGKKITNEYAKTQLSKISIDDTWIDKSINKMHEYALKETQRDTYQAMEAMIHNFCTLQCLPSYEKVWAYDTRYKQWVIITASELCRQFTEGRYLALSVNPKTGKVEAKPITKVWASENTKPMVKVTDIAGNSIVHTFDHRHMTITDDCKIVYKEPKDLQYTTIARDFILPTEREFNYIDISMNTKRNDWSSTLASDLNQLEYSKELAEFLGYYVGDGYIPIHETCINFATDQKVPVEHYKELCISLFGFEPIISVYDRPYQNNPRERVPAHINISLGVKICKAIKKLAGSMAQFKYVPDFVLHGPLEYQQAFLTAYLTCDGCKTKKYVEFTTASQYLIYDLKLMLAARGELLHVSTVKKQMKAHHLQLYTGILGRKAAERLGLDTACARDGTDFEIPKYDLNHCVKAIKKAGIPWGDLPRIPRRNKSNNENSSGLRYHELKLIDMPDDLRANLEPMEHLFRIKVKSIEHLNEYCPTVYDIEVADNENFTMANGLVVHNSRAGSQAVFSNVNFGTDTSEEGRMVTEQFLLASEAGLGAGETAIFPISIFKIKKGITDKGSKNYDLFRLACRVSAKRGLPNFCNNSAPFNAQYYKEGRPETEVPSMGMTKDGTIDIQINDSIQTVDIDKLDKILIENDACTSYKEFDKYTTYVELTKEVKVRDIMSPTGWTVIKKWMTCKDPNQKWYTVKDDQGNELTLTSDHPLPIKDSEGWLRTPTEKIPTDAILAGVSEDKITIENRKIQTILPIDKEHQPLAGYDIETESDRFNLNTIVSHNCLSKDSKIILKEPNGQILFTTAEYFKNLGEGISYLEDYEIYTGEKFVKLINVALRKETDHILHIESSHGYIDVTEEQKIPIIRQREEITVPAGELQPMDVLFWKSCKDAIPSEQQLQSINVIDLLSKSPYASEYGIIIDSKLILAFSQICSPFNEEFIDLISTTNIISLPAYLQYRIALIPYLDERDLYIIKFKKKVCIPAVYDLTEDFGRFYGLLYSEGSVCVDESVIPVTNTDDEIINFVTKFVKEKWNGRFHMHTNKCGCMNLHLGNQTLGSLLRNGVLGYHHGSGNLKLPNWFFYANEAFIKGFLGGVIDGDGSVVPQNYTRIITSSETFARDIQYLAARIGYRASISMEHSKGTIATFGNVKSVRKFDNWRITFDNIDIRDMNLSSSIKCRKLVDFERVKTRMANCPRDYANRVRKIESVPYNDYVYDFETEDHYIYDNTIKHHQCRTRVIGNTYDPEQQIAPGRGNLFSITLNLPYLALEVKESLKDTWDTLSHEERFNAYIEALNARHDQCFGCLDDRFEIIARRKAKNFPFLLGQHLYLGSDDLEPEDEVREVIKHGTIVTGFIGLAETLVVLFGKHHGESDESQKYGLKIIKHINDRCIARAKAKKLNYSCMGSPSEGCCGRLLRLTRKRFGVIPGVTDHEYITNSSHKLLWH